MMVTVNDDPNAPLKKEVRDGIRKASARLDKSSLKLVDLTDRLTEADDIVKKIEANLKDMDQKQADTLRKAGKAMQDSIKAIREELTGKPQEKQGYGNIPQVTVNSVLGEARSYVTGKEVVPGPQEERLIVDAENIITGVLQRANAFFDGKWKQYRSLAENTPVKMFKDYKPIE
jgi:type IV secretory pathway VirB4 component